MISYIRFAGLGLAAAAAMFLCIPADPAFAQFGVIKGAETRPEGSSKVSQSIRQREGKSVGEYTALDWTTGAEYGIRNDVTVSGAIRMQSMDTSGILFGGYFPGDEEYALQFFGLSVGGKFKFLNTAEDIVGLAAFWQGNYETLDKHSGKDKEVWSLESGLAIEKYLMEGQLTWRGNIAIKAVHATRGEVATGFEAGDEGPLQDYAELAVGGQATDVYFDGGEKTCADHGNPPKPCSDNFEWPNFAEMEIELKIGTGLSYRFTNNWYVSGEVLYEEEYETEVNRERWSVFAGPGIHYEGRNWALSAIYLRQLSGGGEMLQESDDLHLIEKTENEVIMKVSYNF